VVIEAVMRNSSPFALATLALLGACSHAEPASTPATSGGEDAVVAQHAPADATPPPAAAELPSPTPAAVATVSAPHHHHAASCADVTVTFASGSAELDASAHERLDQYAACVTPDRPRVLYVNGSTDPSGTAEENDFLARERGRVVADYLRSAGCHMDFEVHAVPETGAHDSRLVWPMERSATVSEVRRR
jgi:outer membrane protein OmpA-like peptidoglycan-associated protein